MPKNQLYCFHRQVQEVENERSSPILRLEYLSKIKAQPTLFKNCLQLISLTGERYPLLAVQVIRIPRRM